MRPEDRVKDRLTKMIGTVVADEFGDCTEREALVQFPDDERPLRVAKLQLEIVGKGVK